MTNYVGETNFTWLRKKLIKKWRTFHINQKLLDLRSYFVWYCDLINDYFNKRGIISIILIALLVNFFYPDYTTYIAVLAVIGICMNLFNKYLNTQRDIILLRKNLSTITAELDEIIGESLQEFLIMNSYDGDIYITPEIETKIRQSVADLVSARLSPAMIHKLCFKYNEESVYTLIASRINIIIMQYTIQNNRDLDNKKMHTQNDNGVLESSTIPYIIKNSNQA